MKGLGFGLSLCPADLVPPPPHILSFSPKGCFSQKVIILRKTTFRKKTFSGEKSRFAKIGFSQKLAFRKKWLFASFSPQLLKTHRAPAQQHMRCRNMIHNQQGSRMLITTHMMIVILVTVITITVITLVTIATTYSQGLRTQNLGVSELELRILKGCTA